MYLSIVYLCPAPQLLPGEEHAVVFPEDHEAEVRQLRLRPAPADAQHPLREHPQRNVHM